MDFFVSQAKPMNVSRVDHIYLAVSDLDKSEVFYDRVMSALEFKKGIAPIGGEPHFHYFNKHLQISIRPARTKSVFDPYAPGLHHICLEVPSRQEVDQAVDSLGQIGVQISIARAYPEYADDYYATFFEDPDGIRFEIVARRNDRDLILNHWDELEGFVNPVRKLKEKLAPTD